MAGSPQEPGRNESRNIANVNRRVTISRSNYRKLPGTYRPFRNFRAYHPWKPVQRSYTTEGRRSTIA
ncbi:hypothetical protein Y032_0011g1266 [Ancylostoma ceylanicum]|uniref:Uncharacterized protein n=1 Tax=Ancylostoma ceylanicum TaxID=53326 RepID=A0A016VDU3_9BILA|nr:hypothetical protein Y032_0011g1266 [Ancylostoma ceylanicum]